MNCDAVQRLLAAERLDRRHADARRHLAACPDCRAWARRLVEAEQHIPHVPVPPTTALDDLLRQILEPAPVGADGLPPLVRPRPRTPVSARERGLYKLSWAVAIAATLLIGVVGGLLLMHRPAPEPPPPKPVPQLVRDWQDRRGQALAAAQTPRERVEKLAALATDLKDQAVLLAQQGDADGMADLAVACRELVEELVSRADDVPAKERPAVLAAAAGRLQSAESEFSRMAAEAGAPAALHDLAFAAADGGKRLRALIPRDAS
jgi:hypothetical protein